ncbi:MAG: Eco57I restriction-modification methylase domain-containing protein [Candidatus Thorarchaeota archaeon]|jgi:Alw26I/Eco31I/Esp3I family type II restriction m6 adenine DNA methyltransferase
MNGGLASQIVAIVRRAATNQLTSSDVAGLLMAEVVRLSSLNWTLNSHLGDDHRNEESLSFSSISTIADDSGLPAKQAAKLSAGVGESLVNPELQQAIRNLNIQELCEILAQIHSLGSRLTPDLLMSKVSPRDLGAFYTPRAVSDYICEKTIGPHLDLLMKSVEKQGLASFQEFRRMKVLDPACGPGVFLLSALATLQRRFRGMLEAANQAGISNRELESIGFATTPLELTSNLYGVDIDKASLDVASVCLALSCVDLNDRNLPDSSAKLRQGDSLISLTGWNCQKDLGGFFDQPGLRNGFEWKSEFPEVFNDEDPGFDFVVMNPPYGRLRPNLAEFLRDRLQTGQQKIALDEFEKHRLRILESAKYFRDSGEYSLANMGAINTYQLFIERALRLTKSGGRIGCIVPSTLLGDYSSMKLRRELLARNTVQSVEVFPESAQIFPSVTQSVCIVIFERGGRSRVISAAFGLSSISEAERKRRTRLVVDDIARMIGPEMILPPVAKSDWSILEKLQGNPRMDSLDWLQNWRGELDLTLDRKHISNSLQDARLLRGSDIGRYTLRNSRHGTREYVDTQSFLDSRGKSKRNGHVHSNRIACQQVSNRSQLWRLKFSSVRSGNLLANSCNYIVLNEGVPEEYLLFLLGVLNSELLNWRFALTNTNNHVSNRELSALPIADPFSFRRKKESALVKDVITAVRDIVEFGQGSTRVIDAQVFSLYGLDEREVMSILAKRNTPPAETDEIVEAHQRLSSL